MRTPSSSDGTIAAVAVTIRMVRLLMRSASRPPHGPRRSNGNCCAASVMPSHVPELVSSSTNHACAIFCIQVPAERHRLTDEIQPVVAGVAARRSGGQVALHALTASSFSIAVTRRQQCCLVSCVECLELPREVGLLPCSGCAQHLGAMVADLHEGHPPVCRFDPSMQIARGLELGHQPRHGRLADLLQPGEFAEPKLAVALHRGQRGGLGRRQVQVGALAQASRQPVHRLAQGGHLRCFGHRQGHGAPSPIVRYAYFLGTRRADIRACADVLRLVAAACWLA